MKFFIYEQDSICRLRTSDTGRRGCQNETSCAIHSMMTMKNVPAVDKNDGHSLYTGLELYIKIS